MKNKLMSLKVDFAFKEIMNNEKVRNSFISAVLKIPIENIKFTEILNPYIRQEQKDDKLGILDVRLKLNGDTDIKIQVVPFKYFKYWQDRTLFYTSKMYIESVEAGKKQNTLKKVINISILNFNLLEEDDFYNSFHIRNDKTNKLYTDKMEWHTIELPKLSKNIESTDNLLMLWAKFINYSDNEEVVKMLATQNENLQIAYEELQKISGDKQKKIKYETRQKAIHDHNNLMEQSKEEGKIEIVKNLLEIGMPIEQILQVSGFTIKQLDALRK